MLPAIELLFWKYWLCSEPTGSHSQFIFSGKMSKPKIKVKSLVVTNCAIAVRTVCFVYMFKKKMQNDLFFILSSWLNLHVVTAGDWWTGACRRGIFAMWLISVKMSHSWTSGTLVPSQCVAVSQLVCLLRFWKAFFYAFPQISHMAAVCSNGSKQIWKSDNKIFVPEK